MNQFTSPGSIVLFVVLIGMIWFGFSILRRFRKVPPGTAMVRFGLGGTRVSFSGVIVLPLLHMAQFIDLTLKSITVTKSGRELLQFKDGEQASLRVSFNVCVRGLQEDVLRAAESYGSSALCDQERLAPLLAPKFEEAMIFAANTMDLDQARKNMHEFKYKMVEVIGQDLNGLVLDDIAIKFLDESR